MTKSPSLLQNLARVGLGGFLAFAGISHLTFARDEFQAQVPEALPLNEDFVVLASGVVEISLGTAFMLWKDKRIPLGWLLAAFFVAVFPGNISQYLTRTDAFGLDTDRKRFIRLFFQPVLIGGALWSSGAWQERKARD
ncbi:DoxX family protein [Deinococcus radiodurans]|jgi:Predicted membrane protein|uniref:DoxX family membrane protein n=1 Tax=Deinococcus radiodurans (strain ATCC 13939 / DSM 20539 / JCM 16871 / CCUG 27074 / LMG 4051 / NBRC 15346 / NCIMB 9279 / VKM B-1422 / R1) TaxID=243230 RepID=Q9RT41_DEIRA|nr:membrane protein [Deinococcus radiodurans]AAF11481.1 hypothetical protein DR_1925 [Deinococcus radiodurans R1 = ATCC 13939 = DSM 20539]ANC70991.1 hypothetical protein A2G07_03990 [Deinococcus radiodurans R1 = ATCC 13939 = DSM 20539]QEM71332.1 hypothetical protein DXG80_05845 [Deinococcus radiodurans]QIP29868.1 hypothetical protein HAV23_12515 [Deinococcus radiodurans]QIP31456.1 hypothetical protein HAV35_04275 [Deinococcus radiodurans]